MDLPRQLSFLLGLLVLGGCAGGQNTTVSYNPDANRTTYETRSYTVSSISGANYASSKSITVRAIARCQGSNCAPEQVQLVFSASGNQQLSLSGIDGQIVANGNQINWTNAEANTGLDPVTEDQVVRITGKFAVVNLPLSQLETIATAPSVEGSIGGQSLDINSGVQAGFQDLLRKIPQG